MKVAKISKKLIKPHTPTPQDLKNYYLSFIDKHIRALNFAVVLFYKSKPENKRQLEESLAKILVEFYPLAGRYIKNDLLIDCSDQGAEFVEAEAVDVELMELVAKADADQLIDLLPDQYFRIDEASFDPLVSIQATHFPCGGVAIAISVSHRVFDTSSLCTFVAAWANASNNRDSNKTVTINPSFDLPSLLPYKDHDFGFGMGELSMQQHENIVVKRLLFDKVAITRLRSKIRPNVNGNTISRVRVGCAVIARALIGLDFAKHGRDRDFIINQAINIRERTIPPQQKHACGNLSISSLTPRVAASEAHNIGIQELVDVMGDAVAKSVAEHADIVSPYRDGRDIIINTFNKFMKEFLIPDTNAMFFNDWSKFGFYEADFGWGKPVWTSIGPQRPRITTTYLMRNKEGDGIEAWLHLNQNHMRCFDQDQIIYNLIKNIEILLQ